MNPVYNSHCASCQSQLVRSRARGALEEFVFVLGGNIGRCESCGARFLCFRRIRIPAPAHSGYAMNGADDRVFMIAWGAIFAGILVSLGIAFWILSRFHRSPF
jgi:hypothetical protein